MPETQFRKGDLVRFRFGIRSIQGELKEDRRPIGIKDRHLYLVEFRPESQSQSLSQIELPADQLQAVQDTGSMEWGKRRPNNTPQQPATPYTRCQTVTPLPREPVAALPRPATAVPQVFAVSWLVAPRHREECAMSDLASSLPPPTPLRQGLRIDYQWGVQKFEIVAIAASIRTTLWEETGEDMTWLHC
jgi:hypothetical protein